MDFYIILSVLLYFIKSKPLAIYTIQIDSNHFQSNKQENNPMNYASFIKYE